MPVNIHFFLRTIFGNPRCGLKKARSFKTTWQLHCAFLYILLSSLHDYDMKVPFYGGRKQYGDFPFLFLNFDTVFRRTERDGKSEIKFEAARMHFLSDVCCSFCHRCCLSYLSFPPENVE